MKPRLVALGVAALAAAVTVSVAWTPASDASGASVEARRLAPIAAGQPGDGGISSDDSAAMLAVEQAMEAHAALDLAGIPEDFKDVYGGVTIDHVTSSLVVQYDASADADRVAHFLDAVADLELQGYPLTLRAVAFTWDELWRVADMIGANSAAYAAEFGVPIDGFAVGIDPVEGTVFVETPAADAALPSTVEVSGIPVEIRTGAPRVSFEF